ncbi:MAG: hypothetical protein KAV87_32480, partial [Desulfobacteraceae bacterium]|nr:hypothetical protein [Desulfobacteraceae bacterium]
FDGISSLYDNLLPWTIDNEQWEEAGCWGVQERLDGKVNYSSKRVWRLAGGIGPRNFGKKGANWR